MQFIIDRFKEPSSWAGIALLINTLAPLVGLPAGIGEIVTNVGTALAAAAAFFIKEKQA